MSGSLTAAMRNGFDAGRAVMKMPDNALLLQVERTGTNRGGYQDLYMVRKGWLTSPVDETIDGAKQRWMLFQFTDDRADFKPEFIQRLVAVKIVVNGRPTIFEKKLVNTPRMGDPAYYEIFLNPTGEYVSD